MPIAHNPGGRKGTGQAYLWLRANVSYQGDDCLIWPFATTQCGYGQFGFEGKHYRAHQMMCEMVHGPRPSKKHVVRHSCGRGKEGCVNPQHLSYGTYSQNQLDRTRDGTRNIGGRQGKLTVEQRAEIKALAASMTHRELAERYGVLACRISQIVNETRRIPRGASFIRGAWHARIQFRGKKTYLGTFKSEEAASAAFNVALARVRQGLSAK